MLDHLGFRPGCAPHLQETLILSNLPIRALSLVPSSARVPSRRRTLKPSSPPFRDLRRLTSRVVDLTRRRQLDQIFEEIEIAKKRYGGLNTIVMNAVMGACVHCGDMNSAVRLFDEMLKPGNCGVDGITLGILLKGLGQARRFDEAFQMLESLEQGVVFGGLKLSPELIYGLLNALLEAGDMLRANGLIARYRPVLHEDGYSVLMYNLLMKGYTNMEFPLGALTIRDEIQRQGLKPDKLTYNTMILACVKSGKIEAAVQLLTEMKEEAHKDNCNKLFPDAVTYTTLLKGLGNNKDLISVLKFVVEMKSLPELAIDRTAYTAMVDALLACGSTKGALCIFGEIIKQAGVDNNLRPKPHLYLSMMRAFADRGDFDMVKKLHVHMWSDSVGSISSSAQREANELLMEAAVNGNQVDAASKILCNIITKKNGFSWTSRGGMVAIRVEALSGFTSSILSPCILPQVLLDDPIEKYMTAFEDAKPVHVNTELKNVAGRFLTDSVLPIVDEWGSCIGILHHGDFNELNNSISTVMRGPPPCVTTSTSIGRVIELILEKRYEMVVVVRSNRNSLYETSYSSSSRPVGVFTREEMLRLTIPMCEQSQ